MVEPMHTVEKKDISGIWFMEEIHSSSCDKKKNRNKY